MAREIEKMYSYFNFVFYITMQKHELLFWSKLIIKNIFRPTVGLSKLIWSHLSKLFFLFQRYRTIFASNIHVHLHNTFNFFFHIQVCCVWETVLKVNFKKTPTKQTNIKKNKKLIHFLISDIRIIDIKKSFSAIRKYLRNIKTAPHKYWHCHKEIH